MTLSEAMALNRKVFPKILVNMVEAGGSERGSRWDSGEMAVHFEKENKIESKVKIPYCLSHSPSRRYNLRCRIYDRVRASYVHKHV